MTMERIKGESSLDACGKFIKYSIFTVNFILFVGGLVVIALGIWALVSIAPTHKALGQDNGIIAAAILLAFGGILAFTTFLGCCGAIKEIKCLLLTFFVFVLIIAILFVVAVILIYKYGDQAESVVKEALNDSLQEAKKDKEYQDAWDYMQNEWKCCGVEGYKDWGPNVSKSCRCAPVDCNGTTYWTEGCETYLMEELKRLAKPILGVVISIIVVLLLSMVFTCSLVLMI